MIKSMTGYGNAESDLNNLSVSIEMRAVNNRYLDVNIRLPRVYIAFEDAMKALIGNYISRGKVDVYVSVDNSQSNNSTVVINEPLADAYVAALAHLAEKYELRNDVSVSLLSRFPDVLQIQQVEEEKEKLESDFCRVLSDALTAFNEMRIKEGEKMYDDIVSRLDTIESLVTKAEIRSPQTVSEYRARLEQRMQEVLANTQIDESRILTEAALFADKVAVAEETVRLRSHISQFREILLVPEPVGRKLDFLIQEMNREANTMGSKGNDVEMARIVVDIKAEIEKIREQIQNVE